MVSTKINQIAYHAAVILLALSVSGCEMPDKNKAQITLPQSDNHGGGVAVPQVLLSPQAAVLFEQGNMYATLTIYKGAAVYDVIKSDNITSQSDINVTWSVPLSGDLTQYSFSVQWRHDWFKDINDASLGVAFAHSPNPPQKLNADNTLSIQSYELDNDNLDNTNNIDDLLHRDSTSGGYAPLDPFRCIVGFSHINQCRLGGA